MLGLVTADVAAPLDPDLLPLLEAMVTRLGEHAVRTVSWDDDSIDWLEFDAVIIRSTWDYTERLAEYTQWVAKVDAATVLLNNADVVRWSIDKRYLGALAAEGVAVAPTTFVAPGDAAPSVSGLHVVKPSVGAGSNGARRCEADEVADHVAVLHAEGNTALIQPYLDRLDELGESSYCFVAASPGDWQLSHVFRKAAILRSTEVEQSGGLFAKEEITARVPSDAELALARQVLATDVVCDLGPAMFARVDIAPHRAPDGTESFVLMELELVEPSFYFATTAGAVDTFADALMGWLPQAEPSGMTSS